MKIVRAAERIEHLHRAHHVRLRAGDAAGGIERGHVAGRVGAGEGRLPGVQVGAELDIGRGRTLTVFSWLMLLTCSLASSAQPCR
jgi:hypothetical protein